VLTYFCKGLNFAPPGQPIIQVLSDGNKPVSTDQPAPGNYDWTRRQIDINVTSDVHALVITIATPALESYGEIAKGQVLLDDFSLEKVN
jgi:hypothetical protein